jgi:hypothetical protein
MPEYLLKKKYKEKLKILSIANLLNKHVRCDAVCSRYGRQFDAAQGLSDSYPVNKNYKRNKNIIHITRFALKFHCRHYISRKLSLFKQTDRTNSNKEIKNLFETFKIEYFWDY